VLFQREAQRKVYVFRKCHTSARSEKALQEKKIKWRFRHSFMGAFSINGVYSLARYVKDESCQEKIRTTLEQRVDIQTQVRGGESKHNRSENLIVPLTFLPADKKNIGAIVK
jgi:hypothetical protein